jgi:hypothetical protein
MFEELFFAVLGRILKPDEGAKTTLKNNNKLSI